MSEQQTAGVFPGQVIARLLNITERRLQQLAREGIVPKAARGAYPLAGCVRGYVKYLQENGQEAPADPDRMRPFERRAFYASELDKLKLAQQRGELVPRLEVEQEMAGLLKIVAELLDTLPDILERDVGLKPAALVKMEEVLDRTREDLHLRLADEEDSDAAGTAGVGA